MSSINRAVPFPGEYCVSIPKRQPGYQLARLFTVFAVYAVILNSMQVGLQALGMSPENGTAGWPASSFTQISLYFTVSAIIAIALILVMFSFSFLFKNVVGIYRGISQHRRCGERITA